MTETDNIDKLKLKISEAVKTENISSLVELANTWHKLPETIKKDPLILPDCANYDAITKLARLGHNITIGRIILMGLNLYKTNEEMIEYFLTLYTTPNLGNAAYLILDDIFKKTGSLEHTVITTGDINITLLQLATEKYIRPEQLLSIYLLLRAKCKPLKSLYKNITPFYVAMTKCNMLLLRLYLEHVSVHALNTTPYTLFPTTLNFPQGIALLARYGVIMDRIPHSLIPYSVSLDRYNVRDIRWCNCAEHKINTFKKVFGQLYHPTQTVYDAYQQVTCESYHGVYSEAFVDPSKAAYIEQLLQALCPIRLPTRGLDHCILRILDPALYTPYQAWLLAQIFDVYTCLRDIKIRDLPLKAFVAYPDSISKQAMHKVLDAPSQPPNPYSYPVHIPYTNVKSTNVVTRQLKSPYVLPPTDNKGSDITNPIVIESTNPATRELDDKEKIALSSLMNMGSVGTIINPTKVPLSNVMRLLPRKDKKWIAILPATHVEAIKQMFTFNHVTHNRPITIVDFANYPITIPITPLHLLLYLKLLVYHCDPSQVETINIPYQCLHDSADLLEYVASEFPALKRFTYTINLYAMASCEYFPIIPSYVNPNSGVSKTVYTTYLKKALTHIILHPTLERLDLNLTFTTSNSSKIGNRDSYMYPFVDDAGITLISNIRILVLTLGCESHFTVADLESLLPSFPHLTDLVFMTATGRQCWLDFTWLPTIVKHCPEIKKLNLTNFRKDARLDHILHNELTLYDQVPLNVYSSSTHKSYFEYVHDYMPYLSELDLTGCHTLTKETILYIVCSFKHLRYITLCRTITLPDAFIRTLVIANNRLEIIR